MERIKKIMVSLFVGLSLAVSTNLAVSAPGGTDCDRLERACNQGDERACDLYDRYCPTW